MFGARGVATSVFLQIFQTASAMYFLSYFVVTGYHFCSHSIVLFDSVACTLESEDFKTGTKTDI